MMMMMTPRLSGENFLFKERENHIGTESESPTAGIELQTIGWISKGVCVEKAWHWTVP